MNKKENNKAKKYYKKNKLAMVNYTYFAVMDLKSALDKFRNIVADAHTEETADI